MIGTTQVLIEQLIWAAYTLPVIPHGVDNGFASDHTALVKQMVAISAIHECGHACGLAGHCNAEMEEDENVSGDPAYPMQYLNQATRRPFIVTTILTGGLCKPLPLRYDHFCNAANFKCFSALNVKDE